MEPIGQKVLIPSSEEIVVASDLDDNSLDNLETRIFDETLDGVLSLHLGEDLIDDLVDNLETSDSLKSEALIKNQLDTKIVASEVTSSEIVDSNIAFEVMEEILLSDDASIEKKETLQKSENSIPVISEAKEINIENNEKVPSDKNVVAFNSNNDMDSEKYDVSENQLQTFFHFTNRQGDNSKFSEDYQEDIVIKYNDDQIDSLKSNSELLDLKSFQSESSNVESFLVEKNQLESGEKFVNPDFLKTTHESIELKKLSKSEEELNDSEIVINLNKPESGLNISKQAVSREENQIVGETVLEEKELNIHEQFRTVEIQDLEENKSDSNKVALGKFEEEDFTNLNKEELTQNSQKIVSNSNFGIDENLNKKETSLFTNSKIIENQKPSVNGMVSDVIFNRKDLFEFPGDQKLPSKEPMAGIPQTIGNKEVPDAENSILKERVNSSIQDMDTIHVSEGQKVVLKERSNELDVPLTEKSSVSEGQKVVLKERSNGLDVPLTEKSSVSEGQKVVLKEKMNLDNQGLDKDKFSKDQQVLAKASGNNFIQGKQESELDESPNREVTKIGADIKIAEKDPSKDFSDKTPIETLNNSRNFSSQENELPLNTKSSTESYNPLLINSNLDASKVSGVKVAEITNSNSDLLRNPDFPFNIEQIVSRVRILRGNGVEEMTLRLNPEDLGQITLKIRQSGAELSIDMRVDNPQAKQLVESGFDFLRNRFLDNDFSYQDLALNVDINEKDSQFGRERRNSEFEKNLSSIDIKETSDLEQEEEKVNSRVLSDSGLNLYV